MTQLSSSKYYSYTDLVTHVPADVSKWLEQRRDEVECGQCTINFTQNWLQNQMFDQEGEVILDAEQLYPLDYAAYVYFTEQFQDKEFPEVLVSW